MSTELKNISGDVMEKIRHDDIKMRPKFYFLAGSVSALIGLVLSILTSAFLISFLRFSIRAHGPMKEYRLEELLSRFSWWIPVGALVCLMMSIVLLRRYDFSYKYNFKIFVFGAVVAVVLAGLILDMAGFNDAMLRRGPMQGHMRQYLDGHAPQRDGAHRGMMYERGE